mmetsp:Transcript_36080/g.55411  ORF Transcript_36080/g.55411 Transcript_36080/m.55411 type:complete len:89 (+) Transcript_36080:8116-8382(+)
MFMRFLVPGQVIDFELDGQWVTGTVEIALDETVKVVAPNPRQGQKTSLWCETEGDGLAPAYSMTANKREGMHIFFRQLYDHIYRQDQR